MSREGRSWRAASNGGGDKRCRLGNIASGDSRMGVGVRSLGEKGPREGVALIESEVYIPHILGSTCQLSGLADLQVRIPFFHICSRLCPRPSAFYYPRAREYFVPVAIPGRWLKLDQQIKVLYKFEKSPKKVGVEFNCCSRCIYFCLQI